GRAHALHADRRLALAPLHVAGETRAAHEPLNPLAANAHALLVQIEMHPPRAVAAAAAAVDRPDPLAQPGIDERSLRQWPTLPSVKTRAGDAEHPAHERDRVVDLLRRDQTEALHRVSLSFAKKAAAFFKTSRSWRSTRTSRRNARNSSRSSLVRPARSPASIPAWRTHRRSDSEETPKFRAISFSERPLARYSSTASRRNSGGYGFWKFDPLGMADDPPCPAGHCRPSAQVSTKTGELHGWYRTLLQMGAFRSARTARGTARGEQLGPF